MDAGCPAVFHFELDAEAVGFNGVEVNDTELVFVGGVARGVFDLHPFSIDFDGDFPGFGDAAFARLRLVVEPVDLDRFDGFGGVEIELNPFVGAFGGPPVGVGLGMVVGV